MFSRVNFRSATIVIVAFLIGVGAAIAIAVWQIEIFFAMAVFIGCGLCLEAVRGRVSVGSMGRGEAFLAGAILLTFGVAYFGGYFSSP